MIILRIIILLLFYSMSYAQCVIFYNEAPLTIKSRDALGQILEPGFRVIFPASNLYGS